MLETLSHLFLGSTIQRCKFESGTEPGKYLEGANRTKDYLEGAAQAIFTNFRDQCTCILGALSENFAA
jgi:hypothetical protein